VTDVMTVVAILMSVGARANFTGHPNPRALIVEATERDIELSEEIRVLPPSKLALHIFSQIIPEVFE